MTHAVMIDLLMARCPNIPSRTAAISELNIALATMIPLLNKHVMNFAKTAQTSIPLDSEGAFDLAALTTAIWENEFGIDRLRDTTTKEIVYRKESEQEYNRNLERYFTYDSNRPRYRVYGTKIYCNPYPTLTNVPDGSIVAGTTYYVTGYTSVTYNGTVYTNRQSFVGVAGIEAYLSVGTGYVSSNNYLVNIYYRKALTDISETGSPIYGTRLQDIVLGLACRMYNKDEYVLALENIKRVNATAPPTESNDIPYQDEAGPFELSDHAITLGNPTIATTETIIVNSSDITEIQGEPA